MAESVTKTNVGITLSPEGMASTARTLDRTLAATIRQLNNAAKTASEAVGKSAEAGSAATTQMNTQLKAMAITLGQLKTLQSALTSSSARGGLQSAQLLGNFAQTASIGKQAAAMAQYKNSLVGASSAMATLKDRVNQFDQASGLLAKSGQLLSQGQLFKKEKIQETAKAYSKVNNEIGSLRGRIALLSADGQKAFQPMLKELSALEKANAGAFSNRRRSNFDAEITSTQKVTRSIKEQLVLAERKEKAARLNLETLRAEVAKRVQLSTLEREAALATSVRAANSRYNNTGLLGGIQRSDVELASRYAQLSSRVAATQERLTAAQNAPNTSAARIQRLIALHDAYQRELGESIAAQNRLNANAAKTSAATAAPNAGGFVGGLKSSAGNLFGGEEGGAYGAGALVGRVGAYALAAGAVYGVISAMKSAISFTIQFEDSLAQLQAISGSTMTEMDRLADNILKVGETSSSSILEITKSATILAQAGYGGSEIEDLLKNVTALADASGSTTDESVDILTSSLGAFQLRAEEATTVTDSLVAALNKSKLSVKQVQLGIQYLGATAKQNNITFQELNAVMGAAADAGIRSGSTIGTGTRQLLVDLIDPSKKLVAELERVGLTTKDVDVKTLGLVEVLQRMKDAGFQGYGALQVRAAAMFKVLSTNIPQMQELIQAQNDQGAAAEAQATKLDSLSSRWQILQNQMAALGADLSAVLIPALKVLVDLFSILIGVVQTLFNVIGGLAKAFVSLGEFFVTAAPNILRYGVSLGVAKTAMQEMAGSTEAAKDILDEYGVSVEAQVRILEAAEEGEDALQTAINDTTAAMAAAQTEINSLEQETTKLITRQEDLTDQTGALDVEIATLSSRFPTLRSEFAKTQGGIQGLIQSMFALEVQARKTLQAVAAEKSFALEVQRTETRGGVRDSLEETIRLTRILGQTSPEAKKTAALMQEAIGQGDFGLALSHMQRANSGLGANPKGRPGTAQLFPGRLDPRVKQIGSNLREAQEYKNILSEQAKIRRELEVIDYSLSDRGQALTEQGMRQTGLATRAGSQGSAGGFTREQIVAQNKTMLAEVEAEYNATKSTAVREFLGGIISDLNAATNIATGDVGKADKKTGGTKKTRGARAGRTEAVLAGKEREYLKRVYENSVTALENAPTLDELPDLLADTDVALKEYLDSENKKALADILKTKPNKDQKAKMMELAQLNAEQLRIESISKISGVLSAAIKKFIDDSTYNIEKQYTEAVSFSKRNATLARARANGLDNTVGTQDVSNSFRTVVGRDADIAEDRYNQAQIPANARRISQYEDKLDTVRGIKADLEFELDYLGKLKAVAEDTGNAEDIIVVTGKIREAAGYLKDSDQEIDDLAQKIRDLALANEELQASYDIIKDSPKTFSDGLKIAAEAVSIEINAASGIGQDIINNLDQPLRAAHTSFKTFFSDVLSGTASVGQAFSTMAQSIISSILDMAAQAAANQIFGLLANFAGAALGGGGLGFLGGNTASSIGSQSLGILQGGLWRGGPIKGYARGGEIQSGLATRDSTIIKAAKGEFMMRKASVDSIGTPMLRAMNARGADALRAVAPAQGMAAPTLNNETNVYLIAPEEKPTLGANDVLAIIGNDVLKGGATKKLIKRVANGG